MLYAIIIFYLGLIAMKHVKNCFTAQKTLYSIKIRVYLLIYV